MKFPKPPKDGYTKNLPPPQPLKKSDPERQAFLEAEARANGFAQGLGGYVSPYGMNRSPKPPAPKQGEPLNKSGGSNEPRTSWVEDPEFPWLGLTFAVLALVLMVYCTNEAERERSRCEALGGWSFRGHCFLDGKEV